MEQKKKIKISLNFIVISVLIILITIFGLILYLKIKKDNLINTGEKYPSSNVNNNSNKYGEKAYYIDTYGEKNYYIFNHDYTNEYDIQYRDLYMNANANEFEIKKCIPYNEYKSFCKKWNLEQKYKDSNMKYIMFSYIHHGAPHLEARLADVEYNNDGVKLYIWDDTYGLTASVQAYIIIIPTKQQINNIEIQALYTKAEFNKMSNKYKVTGYKYTTDDNKKIAQNSYISTKDTKVNEIVNNMLDAIVKKHTIKLEHAYKSDYSIAYIDLINSASKTTDKDNNPWLYETYTDMETITYMKTVYKNDDGTDYFNKLSTSNDTREYMFKSIMEFDALLNYKESSYKLKEENDNYVIEAKYKDERAIYYINKEDYLLNKIDYPEEEESVIVTYTEDEVTIPSSITDSQNNNSSKKSELHVLEDIGPAFKPIIYLYPQEEKEIIVKLGYPEKLIASYPKYSVEGWRVLAKPNGNLVDLNTGRNLYSLYWEGKGTTKFNLNEGFVIKGEESAKFLEEKLEILGLNERETEEFIIFWLPKLEANKYNFIRFSTMQEINEYMPLEFSTEPDSLIRVFMQFKGLSEEITVKEQKLQTPKREGFVAVEWGGTEIK